MNGRTATTGGPLHGVLVADFSRILAGPYCTMLLADMGAEVVKVESPGGDDTRTWMPPVRDGVSTYYLAINRNKRSVALDFTDDDDLAMAHELARRADIIVENFRPGGLAKFDLDYETVNTRNPGIVYASISGFGTSDEARSLPGYDLIVQAMSGLMDLTGSPDGPPYRAGISVFDVMTGMQATIGIPAALHHRRDSGVGQPRAANLLAERDIPVIIGPLFTTRSKVELRRRPPLPPTPAPPTRRRTARPSRTPAAPLPRAVPEARRTAANVIHGLHGRRRAGPPGRP